MFIELLNTKGKTVCINFKHVAFFRPDDNNSEHTIIRRVDTIHSGEPFQIKYRGLMNLLTKGTL